MKRNIRAAVVKMNLIPSPPLASTNKVIEVSFFVCLPRNFLATVQRGCKSAHKGLAMAAHDDGPSFEFGLSK